MQELLELAFDAPEAAQRRSLAILATDSDHVAKSFAHHALGIVFREAGDIDASIGHMRAGISEAVAARAEERASDIRASLGGTLVLAGQTEPGLRELNRAVRQSHGATAARVLMRRAFALNFLGRSSEARASMLEALGGMDQADDPIWFARSLNNLAWIELRLGLVDAAESRLETAEQLFRQEGAQLEVLDVLANRGDVAAARGDFSTALRWYGLAAEETTRTDQPPRPELAEVWASTLLTVGLVPEAITLVRDALGHPMAPGREVDLRLSLAAALLSAGDYDSALREARMVRSQLAEHRREWGRLRAELVAVRARAALGQRQGLAAAALALATELHRRRDEQAPFALTLAGWQARGLQRQTLWREAASYRHRANGVVRSAGWLGSALARAEQADRGGVLRA